MPDLKTRKNLVDRLKEAANYKVSEEELVKQRLSYISASIDPEKNVTKEQIREVLREQSGKR